MKSEKETLRVLTSAGMEIAWRYAWSNFLTLSIIHRPFPLPVALGAFATAALFTRLSRRRNWRRIQAALIQIAGFTIAAFLMAYRFFFRESSFLAGNWFIDLIRQLKAPQQWSTLLPVLCCLLLFWLGGRAFDKNPRNYFAVCLQFDKGLGAFFLLLLIKVLIQVKGGLRLEDPATGPLVIAFFLFSLLAISLTLSWGDVKKAFLAGYHGIGIILGFTTIVVLCGAALILLTFPYLTQIADSAHTILKETAAPLGPIFVKILHFIFGRARFGIETGRHGTPGLGTDLSLPPASGGWEETLLQVIIWGLIAILGLMAIGVFGYLANYMVRWFLKRNPLDKANPQSSTWLLKLLSFLKTLPLSVWDRVLYLLGGVDSAASVYARILRWGSRSGKPPVPSETPGEYGSRLIHCFPKLKEEIEMIVEAFNLEVYGEIATEEQMLCRISSALRRMRSPRHWPSRMRRWFLQQPLQTQSFK
jgi:hypothetical protein